MNRYPLWKNLLILLLMIVGVVFALPNLYGEDPALQITSRKGVTLREAAETKIRTALADASVEPRSVTYDAQGLLVRFETTSEQLKALDVVRSALGSEHVVALNLASATPAWLQALGARPMYLGLDLRGGVHFLMKVDMAAVAR